MDSNPSQGGGRRIFPDLDHPDDSFDKRRIRVRAQYSEPTSGVRIYFKSVDVDDPSSDTAPIDSGDEPNLKLGGDNRGSIEGTSDGKLWVPVSGQPNPYNCQPFGTGGVSCETDANGFALVDFSVTRQPGDNFVVIASPHLSYIQTLIPMEDGLNFKGSGQIQVPESNTNLDGCENIPNRACRSEMLTVWRRLHIEYDVMDEVRGNYRNVTAHRAVTIGTGETDILTGFVQIGIDTNQYEDGYAKIGSRWLPIVSSTTLSVTVSNSGDTIILEEGQPFVIYDDDDFDDEDDPVNGDTDDLFDPVGNEDDLLQAGLLPCINSTTVYSCNSLADAYIWPVYDLGGGPVPFSVFMPDERDAFLREHFQYYDDHDRADFWTIHLLNAYQSNDYGDNDPDFDGSPSVDLVPRATEHTFSDGIGVVLFLEVNRPKEYSFLNLDRCPEFLPDPCPQMDPRRWENRPVSRAHALTREVGVILGGDPSVSVNDFTLMASHSVRMSSVFSDAVIAEIRGHAVP